MRRFGLLAAWVVLGFASTVRAQPLEDGAYNLDLVSLPLLGGNNAIGMGGAYSAVGFGIDTVAYNPAAYAQRGAGDVDWFAWDYSVGFLFPSILTNTNYFDSPPDQTPSLDSFLFFDAGLRLQFGPVGTGLLIQSSVFDAKVNGQTMTVRARTARLGSGVELLQGQLVVAAGLRVPFFDLESPGPRGILLKLHQPGIEVGGTLGLFGQPWRLGFAFRSRVDSAPNVAPGTAPGIAFPALLVLPWEIEAGFAWQFGARPLNRKWQHMERPRVERQRVEAERRAGRVNEPPPTPRAPGQPRPRRKDPTRERYYLVAMDVVIDGPTEDGQGLDAFLTQQSRPRGAHTSFALRFGTEMEPWPNRMKVRAGIYSESNRIQGVSPRVHGTFGFDVRLFEWDLFGVMDPFSIQLSTMVDVAYEYLNWGLGFSFWY